jgi:hypothetical protein
MQGAEGQAIGETDIDIGSVGLDSDGSSMFNDTLDNRSTVGMDSQEGVYLGVAGCWTCTDLGASAPLGLTGGLA